MATQGGPLLGFCVTQTVTLSNEGRTNSSQKLIEHFPIFLCLYIFFSFLFLFLYFLIILFSFFSFSPVLKKPNRQAWTHCPGHPPVTVWVVSETGEPFYILRLSLNHV